LQKMRDAVLEKQENEASLKQSSEREFRQKMGSGYDYPKVVMKHSSGFKPKPELTRYGEVYYEARSISTRPIYGIYRRRAE